MELKTLKDLKKEYRSLKREHCDGCDTNFECDTCKPHFDKLRAEIKKTKDVRKDLEEKG